MAFEIERIYHRKRDIHDVFGGQQRGGISTPSDARYIFLFTGEVGEQHGYQDGFEENGVFMYTGEGQRGDMEFIRGNKAIRDHAQSGKELLLFEAMRQKGYYRFKGEFVCAGYDDTQTGPDTEKKPRKLIRFQLVPLAALSGGEFAEPSDQSVNEPEATTIERLRQKAYAAGAAQATPNAAVSKRSLYKRSQAVKSYVLARAKGICESCRNPAPFKKKSGHPYLEPHHTRQLSDDGLDSPQWVGAICPTCHRRIHHGEDGEEINRQLVIYIQSIEHQFLFS
ncbi:MAG: HNH endonuclease [Thiobacillus sp.]|nr:HNH endonuclease [Thiobacillus sp.]